MQKRSDTVHLKRELRVFQGGKTIEWLILKRTADKQEISQFFQLFCKYMPAFPASWVLMIKVDSISLFILS